MTFAAGSGVSKGNNYAVVVSDDWIDFLDVSLVIQGVGRRRRRSSQSQKFLTLIATVTPGTPRRTIHQLGLWKWM